MSVPFSLKGKHLGELTLTALGNVRLEFEKWTLFGYEFLLKLSEVEVCQKWAKLTESRHCQIHILKIIEFGTLLEIFRALKRDNDQRHILVPF